VSGKSNVAVAEINLLRKNWRLDGLSIIEIGGGYGAYCETFYNFAKVKDYTIVDTKSMLRFAKAYLKEKNIPCTFIDTEGELPNTQYDLLISNICISEIPEEHAKGMLAKLFKQVQKVAIIDTEMKWLEDLIKENFDIASKMDCPECLQANHYIYRGEKL
jgi:hypothetical protein